MQHAFKFAIVTSSALLAAAPLANAAFTTYTIDTAQSQLMITSATAGAGAINVNGNPVDADGFKANLSGNVDIDLTATTLSFLSSSSVHAIDTGSYLPGSPATPATPAPASFAITFPTSPFITPDAVGVTRNLTFSVASGSAHVLAGMGPSTFAVTGDTFAATSGVVDTNIGSQYNASTLGSIANTAAAAGSLSLAGDVETLTVPVKLNMQFMDQGITITLNVEGSVVATRTVPVPGSLAVLGLGGLVAIRRRR